MLRSSGRNENYFCVCVWRFLVCLFGFVNDKQTSKTFDILFCPKKKFFSSPTHKITLTFTWCICRFLIGFFFGFFWLNGQSQWIVQFFGNFFFYQKKFPKTIIITMRNENYKTNEKKKFFYWIELNLNILFFFIWSK